MPSTSVDRIWSARVEEMRPEDWDRCVEVCLTSQFNCARLAVPLAGRLLRGAAARRGHQGRLAAPAEGSTSRNPKDCNSVINWRLDGEAVVVMGGASIGG